MTTDADRRASHVTARGSDHGGSAAPHDAKPNKPSASSFRQQRLVAWQPVMSPPYVVACLLATTAIFAAIGTAVIVANNDVVDYEWRYDDTEKCTASNALFWFNDTATGTSVYQGCSKTVNFTLDKKAEAPVYLYYKLTNFYQNHRRYAKSRNDAQLRGKSLTSSTADCNPFSNPGDFGTPSVTQSTPITVGGANRSYGDFVYNPCGLVPWSMFNDSFALYRRDTRTTAELVCDGRRFSRRDNAALAGAGNCTKAGITWTSDEDKYKTADLDTAWTGDRADINGVLPATTDPFMRNGWYAGEAGHAIPIATDQDLQVWLRTASLPSFRKLYRVIDVDLPAGDYSMVIHDYFPVDGYDGTKAFALATVHFAGGKNTFLGIGYVVVAAVCLVLGIGFLMVHMANGDNAQRALATLQPQDDDDAM